MLLVVRLPAIEPPPASPADATDEGFLRDYAETRGFMLGRPVNATPTPDGSAVLFLRAKGPREPSQEIYEFNVASCQTRRLLSPDDALKGAAEQLSPEEKARRERQRISVGGFTAFSVSKDSALVLLSLSGKLYVLRRADGKVTELATGEGTIVDPKFSPDSRSVAYVRNQDVCVFDLASGKERAVTTGGTETVSHGLAEFVAQEEMDRFSGYWWSPDSKQIAYQESDASEVEIWYAADPAQPGNPPERTFYPRPGKPNVKVRVGVAPVDAPGQTVWLDWDHARYEYLGKVTWTEQGPLTLTVLSRDQTDLALLKADPTTGKTMELLTERSPAWVALDQDVPRWASPEKGFFWTGVRAGHNRLEFRRPDGSMGDVIYHSAGFLSLAGVVDGIPFVLGNLGQPMIADAFQPPPEDRHQKVPDADTYLTIADLPLSMEETMEGSLLGWNTANFADSKTVYARQSQSPRNMPVTYVGDATRHPQFEREVPMRELPSIAQPPPFVPNLEFVKVGPEQVPAIGTDRRRADSRSYYAAVIRPRAYDAKEKEKLPVIVDVYGGPGHQQVVAQMRPYLLDQWMADQGFIVVAIDGRGTPGRDADWEHAIAGHFGSVTVDDQVEALKLLGAKYPEMDLDRVGITGWSFGGYMSALAVLRRPDVFKAAVAGAPVVDWMDYDTCYTERYLGVPGAERWPDAYKEGSLLTYADGLSRPLLLIHGTADDNVYFRHSLRLAQELFRAGKPFDFLPLSSFTHMVPDPVVRARLEERVVRYFHEHL